MHTVAAPRTLRTMSATCRRPGLQFPSDQVTVWAELRGSTAISVRVNADPWKPEQFPGGNYCQQILIERVSEPQYLVSIAVSIVDRDDPLPLVKAVGALVVGALHAGRGDVAVPSSSWLGLVAFGLAAQVPSGRGRGHPVTVGRRHAILEVVSNPAPGRDPPLEARTWRRRASLRRCS